MVLTMLGWLAGWVVLIMADVEPDLRLRWAEMISSCCWCYRRCLWPVCLH